MSTQEVPNDMDHTPEPSHNMTGKYAILQEINDRKCQTMLSFIRADDNMEALAFLQQQLEPIKWELMENGSTFDLEMEYLVSAQTAKEMSKVDLNPIFHRKFDGKLQLIDFGFREKDKNSRKIDKVFDLLGNSGIEEFISDEDIDPEDLENCDMNSESDYSTTDDSITESSDESDDEPRQRGRNASNDAKSASKLPPSLMSTEKPRFVNKAQRNRR